MSDPIVVVGGGITGLAAAHEILRQGYEPIVLESSDRVGGKIKTSEFNNMPVDEGADAFLARVPWGTDLVRELGLEDQLVSPRGREARIFANGSMHPLPKPNVLGIPLDPDTYDGDLLSERALDDLRTDLARAEADPVGGDETLGSLLRQRVGDEVAERLVHPLLGAINAGDCDRLSAHATSPQISSAAAANPSLLNGLRAQTQHSDPDAPVFYSLPDGLGTIIDALSEELSDHIRLASPVDSIVPKRKRLVVELAGGDEIRTPAAVLAVPAHAAAPIVQEWRRSREALDAIEFVSVVLVTLSYPADVVTTIPPGGSGFLVPHSEHPIITACSWSSSKWEHLDDGNKVVVRVSLGHDGADAVINARDDDILSTVKLDLAETMDIREPPSSVRVSRWPRSFPQYTAGHLDRVELIEEQLGAKNVFVAGASMRGIGIPACIRQGRDAAKHALTSIVDG